MTPLASGSSGMEASRPEGATFGVDAPWVPAGLAVAGVVALTVAVLLSAFAGGVVAFFFWLVALLFVASTASYLYTTLSGKFSVWSELLSDAHLVGDEHAVDLGCGRGAVLIMLARRLTTGRVSGIDVWRTRDQSGNDIAATKANARACAVEDRVELNTGDITALPYHDEQFDLVVSSLAIHNIGSMAGRRRAIAEAVRVLRPGGKMIIADIGSTQAYETWLAELGMTAVTRRGLGVRGWWGGPWLRTYAVTATRAEGPAA